LVDAVTAEHVLTLVEAAIRSSQSRRRCLKGP
jgi:hypothetical protein